MQWDCAYDPPVRWYRYNGVCTEDVDGDHEEKDERKPLRSHTGLSYSTVCSRDAVHSKSLRLGVGLPSNQHIKENASVSQLLWSDSLS